MACVLSFTLQIKDWELSDALEKHIHKKKERRNLPLKKVSFHMSFTAKFGSNEYLAINTVVFDMVHG